MKRKAKGLITIGLSLLMLIMSAFGNGGPAHAQTDVGVINPKPENIVLVPGETKKLLIPIKAVGADISSVVITVDGSSTPYKISTPILRTEGTDYVLGTIYYALLNQYIEIEVIVPDSAKIGVYPIEFFIQGNAIGKTVDASLTVMTQILKEKEPAQLTVNDIKINNPTIGQDMTLSFVVRNVGEIAARSVYASVDYANTGMIAGYPTKKIKVDDVLPGKDIPLSLPIKVLPTAETGLKTLTVTFTYKMDDGTELSDSHEIYVTLVENQKAPALNLSGFRYNESAKAGDRMGLVLKIVNDGGSTAVNPRIFMDESNIGPSTFIKDYYTEFIETNNVKAGETIEVELPLLVAKKNHGGLYPINLKFAYFDADGVEYESSVTIYPYIEEEVIPDEGTPIILITNVSQSPEKPEAGERLDVSFDIVNKSNVTLNEFKVSVKNLSNNTFIPVNTDPYIYIGEFKGGETKRITIPLTVSEDAPEGMSYLTVAYTYLGGGDIIDIPVLDIQNDLGSASKPRLIVSKYEADIEELRAGSIFNFNFEIRNTHSSVAAKNIIITISGKSQMGSEVFSVTQGSNSFFVSKIGPGEVYSDSLEMKIKSDTATGAYPIYVTIEYEYDGIEPNPQTGKIGEVEEHELNLQVVENARPVVDYVSLYSWDEGVKVGMPASISFEFYNMGKSTLNNVTAMVEGDFMISNGNMFYIGNVNAGDRSYVEFEVIPNVEGLAYGVIKITFEDSNGDEQVYTKEFEWSVMGQDSGGWYPGGGDGDVDVFNPDVPQPKKEIMPLWAFIAIQAAILVIFIPVSRKVVVNIYKRKLRSKEDMY